MAASPEDGWLELLARYRPLAVRFVAGLVDDRDAAEDLFGDIAAATLQRLRAGELTLESAEHGRNYLFRALRNRAVDLLRSGAVARSEDSAVLEGAATEGPGPLDDLLVGEARELAAERLTRLVGLLAELPSRDQEAVRLRYGEGLSLPDMSARTGVAISTLHSRIGAALAKIRRKLGREGQYP